jgi:hypothetical protein
VPTLHPGGDAMGKRSRPGEKRGAARSGVRRARDGGHDPRAREVGGEAPRPALEPEPGVELNVGEDPGGVPDPEWK